MRVRLEPGRKPIKVKGRRYSPEQRKFLHKYVEKLKELDFFVDMPTAEWQAAPLLVPKLGSKAKFRMAVDLRPVNAATIKESWPMPHLNSEVNDFAKSSCFSSLDFVSGYWQLPLEEESQSACGVVTPFGVVASKRVLPGLANATAYFQRTVEPLFSELREHMKAWLDDFNLHATSESELLDYLETFFRICKQHRLYLSALKCRLFSKELKWCGRVVSEDGYKMDPARLSGLQEMSTPKTAAELSQFINCCRWMSIAIPNFIQRAKPLTDMLEAAYGKSKKRTSKSIRNITVDSLAWGDVHEKAFTSLQESLRDAVKLSYPNPDKALCVFTDASNLHWSGIVTQVDPDQLSLPLEDQRHEPLAFLSSAFTKCQRNWTTFEKEGYAIFQTFSKVDYLFLNGQETHVFTDHRNLMFVYAPTALEPALGRHVVCKVQRWALYLSRFDYIVEHIEGKDNVFADILTRWTRDYRNNAEARSCIASLLLTQAKQLIPSASDIVWPNFDNIRSAQSNHVRPEGLEFDDQDRLWKKCGRIWIPSENLELQLKIMVASHCGTIGHRGKTATLSILCESFWWLTMEHDIEELVRSCLHCIVTRAGEIVPRPLGLALHGIRPNEVVHMDFLYMGAGKEGKRYILLIRDDHSSYVWLWPTEAANADTAADALCVWLGVFGGMEWLVSDQGSHFKNQVIQKLTDETRINHHFTTAYCPWANGSVERICREVLRACRALLGEWKLGPTHWPAVTEAIQSVLNHAPLKTLGLRDPQIKKVYRTPLEVFMGHKPIRPLMRAVPISKYETATTTDELHITSLLNIESIQNALQEVHREVAERRANSRARRTSRHDKLTNVVASGFREGDWVLVRKLTPGGHKLRFLWRGPRRIVAVRSDWVYEVENIIDGKREIVHARRMHLYRADMDGAHATESLKQTAAHLESKYQIAEGIKDIRNENSTIKILIQWEGLPDDMDWTWEPVNQVYDDLPGLLQDFLHTAGKRNLKRRALAQCNLS